MIKVRKLEINGETLPNLYVGGELELPFFNEETETLTVPGRPGSVKKNRKTDEWKFPLTLIYRNREEQLSAAEIGNKVVNFIDKGLSEIRITDQDWIWYGYIDGPFNISVDTNGFAEFEINITLADPYRYSLDTFKNTASSDSVTVVNSGTASTPFTLEATALKDSSYFMVTDVENNHFMIGEDSEEVQVKDYSPALLRNEFSSLTGFSRLGATETIDSVYLGGQTGASFNQFNDSWGLNLDTIKQSSGWRGGAYSQTYRPTQNFKGTFKASVRIGDIGTGKVGHYIYDENNRIQFSIGFRSSSSSNKDKRVMFVFHNENNEERILWNRMLPTRILRMKDIVIYFSIKRIGIDFELSYWIYENHSKRNKNIVLFQESRTFRDSGEFYQRKITRSIFALFRGNANFQFMSLLGAHYYELLDKPANAVDYIIKRGDLITLDTKTQSISVNGEPMLSEKSFSSNFFEIESGMTHLLIAPTNTFDTTVKWRDRYK